MSYCWDQLDLFQFHFIFFSYSLILATLRWGLSLICDAIFEAVVTMLTLIFFPLCQYSVLNTTTELRYGNTFHLIQQGTYKLLYKTHSLKVYNSWSDCCTIRIFLIPRIYIPELSRKVSTDTIFLLCSIRRAFSCYSLFPGCLKEQYALKISSLTAG